MDTENTRLDIGLGKVSEEDWQTYYRVRRVRTSWYVAGFLHWDNETHFMSDEDIRKWKEEKHDNNWVPVTRSEFLFLCEYVEENFNIDYSIQELLCEADDIVKEARMNRFTELSDKTMRMVCRTILLDRYFPDELKDKLNGGDK